MVSKILLVDRNNEFIANFTKDLLKQKDVINSIRLNYEIRFESLPPEIKKDNEKCIISHEEFTNESNILALVGDNDVVKCYTSESLIEYFLMDYQLNPFTKGIPVFYKL